MYRVRNGQVEAFLAHPGGPFFTRKDDGYWSVPKGEIERGEDLLAAAIREFKEETASRLAASSSNLAPSNKRAERSSTLGRSRVIGTGRSR